MATLFERLGLDGEEAATAFHHYGSYMMGSTLFAAARKESDVLLNPNGETNGDTPAHQHRAYLPGARKTRGRGGSKKRPPLSIDDMPDLSVVDPARDEELFAQGLRQLVEGFDRRRRRKR